MAGSWRDMGRVLSGWSLSGPVGRAVMKRLARRGRSRAETARSVRALTEALEDRRLLSVLPLPVIVAHDSITNAAGNQNTPSIAYDPLDANKLVTVFNTADQVQVRFSANGGASWADLTLFTGSDPSVAFDRLDNFYVVYAGSGNAQIELQKFNFSGVAPTLTFADVVFAGGGLEPVIAVDSNPITFTDPAGGGALTDTTIDAMTGQGPVYVAWSNGASVLLAASVDGAVTFTNPTPLSDGGQAVTPRMVISQGILNSTTVKPGQLNVIWDDYSGATDTIKSEVVRDPVIKQETFTSAGAAPIGDALDAGTPASTPTVTTTTINVAFADPTFVLGSLNLSLSLTHPDLSQISITLSGPGAFAGPYTLVQNGIDPVTGAAIAPAQGITGANMLNTIFSELAANSITTGAAPFTGFFLPEVGAMPAILGQNLTGANMAGAWTLTVTDFQVDANPPTQSIDSWSLAFGPAFGGADRTVATTTVTGNPTSTFTTNASPVPIKPGAVIASDNTLGNFSPYQGRLYVAYTSRETAVPNDPNNTDIFLSYSVDGGATWLPANVNATLQLLAPVNDDSATADGKSGANIVSTPTANPNLRTPVQITGRPQFSPSISVDPATGTLVLTWLDTRDDGAAARVATYMATSIDGGGSFGPQTFLNRANLAQDAITGEQVTLGPIPDNQSAGNANRDTLAGFGSHQDVVALAGKVYALWSGNENGLLPNMDILGTRATIAAGPRIVDSTMGPVSQSGDIVNPPTVTGLPQTTGFVVQFDRPIDPTTFPTSAVKVIYRSTATSGNAAGTVLAVASVTPLDLDAVVTGLASQFRISLTTPQTAVGTYSYSIAPVMRDKIRTVAGSLGNLADQNMNATGGDAATAGISTGDVYAMPRPIAQNSFNGTFFTPAFDAQTLPLIVPGPHLVSAPTLTLNAAVSFLDVTFDRDMDSTSFTPSQVLQLFGPAGVVSGPFTVTGNPLGADPDSLHPRTYRIGFPIQTLSGTYILTLGPGIRSKTGEAIDTNLNAGVDLLNDRSTVTTPVTFSAGAVGLPIGNAATAGVTTTSTLAITNAFVIKGATLQLNLNYATDPDLEATLIAPDGTRIKLFSNVGSGNTTANFTNTIFDDAATTPIQSGGAPFFGRFNPQQPLSALLNMTTAGTWRLEIKSDVAGTVGTLASWALTFQKAVPVSGLGEPVADRGIASFRIYTTDPANPVSHGEWTSVGPASISGNSGSIGGIAVDPSDPSGNTVYIGGASGGVWKTSNFLTTDAAGPTWIPLTDFGPVFSLNIGSIAVFGRNNDPDQSIIFAATGNGDSESTGVGVIRSMDGGATWTLLSPQDSTPQSTHSLLRTSSFKIVVDPRLTPAGDVTVYLAVADTTGASNGGIWRSFDSGNSWTQVLAGNATDVVLDPNSGVVNAISNPTGNLDIAYAAIRGQGVFMSTNRGTAWTPMAGGVGNPLIRNADTQPFGPVPVAAPASDPTGAKGRILLAKPALTGNPNQDVQYQGWLYALVVAADGGGLDGLYMTKDFGQNWTVIPLSSLTVTNAQLTGTAVPTNDYTQPAYNIFGTVEPKGNYDVSFAIDPTNPNVVYIGGRKNDDVLHKDAAPTRVMRVDTTGVADAHAFYIANSFPGNGAMIQVGNVTAPAVLAAAVPVQLPASLGRTLGTPLSGAQAALNLVRDPSQPFLSNATVYVSRTTRFVNTGFGASWVPFDGPEGSSDNGNHRMLAFTDPLTGLPRLVFGDDQTVSTGVDDNGQYIRNVGTAVLPFGNRTGNLQLTQFYYGAAQPSNLAAQVAAAMFYGASQANGSPKSATDPVGTGNLVWVGTNSEFINAASVATDQTGTGTIYQYIWPRDGGGNTNFFQVNGVGRTFGLLQANDDPANNVGQWPGQRTITATNNPLNGQQMEGTINFAVNPVNGNQIIIGSSAGRIFGTSNQGQFWSVIADPTTLDGTQSLAMAFGAPNTNDPTGALNNFMYVGTNGGHVFVTTTGGGNGQWTDLNVGLATDNAPVMAIIPNPQRGSHDVYVVTQTHVYYLADSSQRNPVGAWVDVTGNLFAVMQNPFNNPNLAEANARSLNSMAVDWRFTIPTDVVNGTGAPHPALYASGNSGVFRSLDNGTTWSLFPSTLVDGAQRDGGYLPSTLITDLDLVLGNIDPTNGRPKVSTGPDMLLATTYGRGEFGIRLSPVVVPGSARLSDASDTGLNLRDNITNQIRPTLTGISAQTAFGNKVRITLLDMTNPASPVIIGGYNGTPATDVAANYTDAGGRFTIQVNPGTFATDGAKAIGVRATDDAGAVGEIARLSITIDTSVAAAPGAPDLTDASDTGISNTDNITSVTAPVFTGTAEPNALVELFANGGVTPAGSGVADVTGAYVVTLNPALIDGTYIIKARQTTVAGNVSPLSAGLTVVIDTTPPVEPSVPDLTDASDTGTSNTDNFTADNLPVFAGTAEPFATVDLFANGVAVGSAQADVTGAYTVAVGLPLADGTYDFTASQTDQAGNQGPLSAALSVTITATAPAPPSVPDLVAASDSGMSQIDNVTNVTTPTFAGTALAGATVELFANNVSLGTVIATAQGTYTFTVAAPMADGTYQITAQQTDVQGNVSPMSAALTIRIDATPPAAIPVTFTPTEQVPFTGAVARFNDASGANASASIDWGDGTTSVGTVTLGAGGVFSVNGTHTYADPGSFTVVATVTDQAGNTSTIVSTADVANAAVIAIGGFTLSADEGTLSSIQTLATFTDPGGPEAIGQYSADVDWGDSTSSSATVTFNAVTSQFEVSGSHDYDDSGTYTITVTIHHLTPPNSAAPDVTVTSTAQVQNVEPTPSISGPSLAYIGDSVELSIGATDPSAADRAAGFSYTIDWGDGSPIETIAAAPGNGAFQSISHTYDVARNYTVTLSATDKDNSTGWTSMPIQIADPQTLQSVTVNNGDKQRSKIFKISFSFFERLGVTGLSLGDLNLLMNGNIPVSLSKARLHFNAVTGEAVLDLHRLKLADGDYQAQIGVAGIIVPLNFFKLAGDANGNGVVTSDDVTLVGAGRRHFTTNADLNGDGVVDDADVSISRKNVGHKLSWASKSLKVSRGGKTSVVNYLGIETQPGTRAISIVISNSDQTRPLTISGLSFAGKQANTRFAVIGRTWGDPTPEFVVPPNTSVTVRIYYKGKATGSISGNLSFNFSSGGAKFRHLVVPIMAKIIFA